MKKINLIILLCLFLVPAALAADGYISDPTMIGIGARSLGMGKTYVAVAENGDAIFANPAGTANISNIKLSSMYSSFLNDINYTLFGGVYPLGGKSAIGLGVVRASASDILLTSSMGTLEGYGDWSNTVVLLSYGRQITKNILVGGNLKYFMVGGEAGSGGNASGSGVDMDLGILYPANDNITLGANWQNVIPGTKVRNDDIISILKLGTKFTLISDKSIIPRPGIIKKLYGNIDYDLYTSGSNPGVAHYGFELWPTSNFALRVGFDDNDLTSGIGLRINGVELNYAYHAYSEISENTTHYFSIGYLGEDQKDFHLTLKEPADKSIIYADHVKVQGKIEAADESSVIPKGITIRANGIPVALADDRTFSVDVPVANYGKNRILVKAADEAGNSQTEKIRLIRLVSFDDIPDGYWAKMPIENDATVGLFEGYPDGYFRPENALTRAELATLLVRAKGIILPQVEVEQVFSDVPTSSWAAKYVAAAVRYGLVTGYPDKTFRPNNRITRAEGITVMARFEGLDLSEELSQDPYLDVQTDHWAAKYIQAAKNANMLGFLRGDSLLPKSSLVRSEVADMLSTTSLASGKIKYLYTWED